ncbi:MAG: ABC transporter substrate-binding protein, partial [Dehalococcoidia bacterium]
MTLHRVTSQRSVAIAALVAVVAVAAAVAWLVFGRDEGGTLAPQGNVYVEGVAGTWEQINPLYAQPNPVDEALSRLVFSGLTRLGPDGAVLPDMADNWDVTSDGCTYTFRLKRGLRWHDGEPVTSADVAFTIRHVQDSAFAGSGNLVNAWTGVGVETPDE